MGDSGRAAALHATRASQGWRHRAAENGATTSQLMAIFGWRDIKQAELYTRRATQKTLAADGMNTILARNETRSNVSNFRGHAQKKLDTKS